MASVIQRTVKGTSYFYLEQTLRVGKQFKKFYEYLGSEKPSQKKLTLAERNLIRQVDDFLKNELIKPRTRFIDAKIAKTLEGIKQETEAFLNQLSVGQKKAWLEREREKFITNTNAIEGSTLTLDETHRILKLNEKWNDERERLEVLNMEKCLERYDVYLKIPHELNESLILQLHFILLNEIPKFDQYKGIWRPVNIEIRTSRFNFPRYELIASLMQKTMTWYAENKLVIHPVELAAFFHCKLTTVHPFADGNGRMARLLMNYILQLNGFPFTNIPVKKRDEYFETQEHGHSENYKTFTQFLINQMKENYKELKKQK